MTNNGKPTLLVQYSTAGFDSHSCKTNWSLCRLTGLMSQQYPSYPFCAKNGICFMQYQGSQVALEPPLRTNCLHILLSVASHHMRNKTPTLLLWAQVPTHGGERCSRSLRQPHLRWVWEEQLAQGVTNSQGFISKASRGWEQYFPNSRQYLYHLQKEATEGLSS